MQKENLFVIKIGGNIIDDEHRLSAFVTSFAALKGKKILVHGGGKLATKLAADLQIPQQMVDGRRITDSETLKIITMVYAGLINKSIVAALQQQGANAVGLTGADGDLIRSVKRTNANIDYGFVGDVKKVNGPFLSDLLQRNITVVVAPVTHDGGGMLLNTNADTIAQEIASEMSREYSVNLVYSFEKKGVLTDVNNEDSVIPLLTMALYKQYRQEEKIFSGMIPKIDNAFAAIASGVNKVTIGKAEDLEELSEGRTGTILTHE
jgi:acetylglutamate kinase